MRIRLRNGLVLNDVPGALWFAVLVARDVFRNHKAQPTVVGVNDHVTGEDSAYRHASSITFEIGASKSSMIAVDLGNALGEHYITEHVGEHVRITYIPEQRVAPDGRE